MTIHESLHGEQCMCTGCHYARVQARARERILREQVDQAIPERDVHWPWLHGPTPPGTVPSPREAFERTHAHLMPRRAS